MAEPGTGFSRILLADLNTALGVAGQEVVDAPDDSLRARYLVLGGALVTHVELSVGDEASSEPGSAADATGAGTLRGYPSLQVLLYEEVHSRLDGIYLALGEAVWRLWNSDISC